MVTGNGFRFYLSDRRRVRQTLRHFLSLFSLSLLHLYISFRFPSFVFPGTRAERGERGLESGVEGVAATSRSRVALGVGLAVPLENRRP